ncbi:hypothetical protein [Streptomyces sp. 1222.5]|uniref:hypothetical protein n=1 Tax=Streptomyces sp. 1222.5 TaxID=1881026 RepID=UPI003D753842
MTRPGGVRRRWWRWAVTGWVVAVAVGGGLTLVLREQAGPKGPYVWQDGSSPPARPRGADRRPDGDACATGPTPQAPEGAPAPLLACAYSKPDP